MSQKQGMLRTSDIFRDLYDTFRVPVPSLLLRYQIFAKNSPPNI